MPQVTSYFIYCCVCNDLRDWGKKEGNIGNPTCKYVPQPVSLACQAGRVFSVTRAMDRVVKNPKVLHNQIHLKSPDALRLCLCCCHGLKASLAWFPIKISSKNNLG